MRSLNRVALAIVVLLAAAGLAAFLRAKGDRHRLGGATDLAGSLGSVRQTFNEWTDHPRLLLILSPACPVCLEGAESVQQQVLAAREDLRVIVIWMEALPFDITRNPARRVETFAEEKSMVHFYDMQQVSGEAFAPVLSWPEGSLPWDVFLFYPAGVAWRADPPTPVVWFHQREIADPDRYRTGDDLVRALVEAVPARPVNPTPAP
jgi:hypothetical protein